MEEKKQLFEASKAKAGNVVETYIRNRDGSIRAVERKAGMEEELEVQYFPDGFKFEVKAVVPYMRDGFFILRNKNMPPLIVKSIIVDGVCFMAGNTPAPVNSLVSKLAILIKELVEGHSELIKVGRPGLIFISAADLCQAFNAALGSPMEKERTKVKIVTVNSLCRDLGFIVDRINNGWRVALETKSLLEMAERYGLGEMNFSLPPGQDFLNGDLK